MKKVTLQSVVFSNSIAQKKELFYRTTDKVKAQDNSLILDKGGRLSTDTYMNCFDVRVWSYYTGLSKWGLEFEAKGRGIIQLWTWSEKGRELLLEKELESEGKKIYSFTFQTMKRARLVYFNLQTSEQLWFQNARYISAIEPEQIRPIHLSLIICTYKRNRDAREKIELLKNSSFFDRSTDSYGKMSVKIIDNGSELPEISEQNIRIYHNPNTGGSGGFSKGIIESRNDEKKYNITHVILMDDDAGLMAETLYRLYALLSLVAEQHKDKVVAGRMFRTDDKEIQHTASEIWNGGRLKHAGGNKDMSKLENLLNMNASAGQYTGWWLGCFPMEFARANLPLPFFLHCDDVEYGLRHGGRPIVLNGIQVWHETGENRASPMISYYDIRNSFIVNTMYGYFKDETDVWRRWLWWLAYYICKRKGKMLCACVQALKDYLKGRDYFLQHINKKWIKAEISDILVSICPITWLLLWIECKCKGKKAFLSYKEILEKKQDETTKYNISIS